MQIWFGVRMDVGASVPAWCGAGGRIDSFCQQFLFTYLPPFPSEIPIVFEFSLQFFVQNAAAHVLCAGLYSTIAGQ